MKRRLERAPETPGDARRHPEDGWRLAEPMPLSARAEALLLHVARALLPPPPAPRGDEIEARVVRHARVMFQYMPPHTAKGVVGALFALDAMPVLTFGGRRRLSQMSPEEASGAIQRIADSPLLPVRMLALAPKGIILSAYFDQPEVHAAVGYEAEPFFRERIALRQRLLRGEAARDEDLIPYPEPR